MKNYQKLEEAITAAGLNTEKMRPICYNVFNSIDFSLDKLIDITFQPTTNQFGGRITFWADGYYITITKNESL